MREVGKELEYIDFLGRDSFSKERVLNFEKIKFKFKWRKSNRMKI